MSWLFGEIWAYMLGGFAIGLATGWWMSKR